MNNLSLVIMLLAGLAALFFGRQLFWLFVGITGFLAGFQLATQLFADQPDWIILLIALVTGLAASLLYVVVQYLAMGVAGFLAGGYLGLSAWQLLGPNSSEPLQWGIVITAAIVGAILTLVLVDWALIVLSSVTGAAAVVQLMTLEPVMQVIAFAILLAIGISFQAHNISGKAEPVRQQQQITTHQSH